ncbi:MAG TPA: pre-peptidase C-terminal domain-containing protein [Longimicrobiales bacterium]
MRSIRPGRVLVAAATILSLASCGDPTGPRTPTSIAVLSGNGQIAPVGSTLPAPVVVEVKDLDGRPIRGLTVSWTIGNGGGSSSEQVTKTDRMGHAQVVWTLGTASGQNRLNASVQGVAPAVAVATAQPGPPAGMAIISGEAQIGLPSLGLADRIRVRVNDQYGNAITAATVTFEPATGTVSPPTALTNVNGVAQTEWTLGTGTGVQSLDARVPGTSATVRFTATAVSPGDITQLDNDAPLSGLAAEQGENRFFRIPVPPNTTRLSVTVGGGGASGDVDLYIAPGSLPSTRSYDCRSITPTATESCVVQTPVAGDWYALLDAYTPYSNVTLRASYVIGGSVRVAVTGLPPGATAGVTLTGEGSYTRTITASDSIPGLFPGSYTITAYHVIDAAGVYSAAPKVQQFDVASGAQVDAMVAYALSSGAINLDIAGAYITQSIQRPTGSVPLVAGRDGFVRVLARADALNTETPAVRVRVYHNGTLVDTRTITAPAAAVPVVNDEGELTSTWNVLLPGSLIQPGMALLVDVDPSDVVAEADEADNSFPASGTPLALDVRDAAVLRARMVPVRQVPNELEGDVNEANKHTYVTMADAIYPFPGIDVDVRAAYSFDKALPTQYDTVWSRLLNEVLALRVQDASDRYYYGVIKPAYTNGGTGLGYIGLPAALGVEWPNWRAETVAHEWGHNFGRRHVACGGPSGTDPDYPHTERPGALGYHGWDKRFSTLISATTHQDVMSYCQPYWASDYTYESVLAFRAAEADVAAGPEPSLVVWGRIAPDGIVLEPAFEVAARPVLPRGRGKYRLTGTDASGATVLDLSFDAFEVDHMPDVRHFAWAVPLRSLRGVPQELRVSGGGAEVVRRAGDPLAGARAGDDIVATREGAGVVRLAWNAAANPMAIVRDASTGMVLSFARGGDVRVATSARELEITLSNGVRSTARRAVVAQ